jgi:uncharacterized phage infection (PIP) family protein YhgE
MLGLAVQDLYGQVKLAQPDTTTLRVSSPISVSQAGSAQPNPGAGVPSATADSVLIFANLVDSLTQAGPNIPIADGDADRVERDARAYISRAQQRLESDRQAYNSAIAQVKTAQSEIDIYRKYVSSLDAAAKKLRQLLGPTAEQTCTADSVTKKYANFCALPAPTGRQAIADILQLLDPAKVVDVVAQGENLAAQAKDSQAHLTTATAKMADIVNRGDAAWKAYEPAFQAALAGISSGATGLR